MKFKLIKHNQALAIAEATPAPADGAPQSVDLLRPGMMIGHFKILKKIGGGGGGYVYLVRRRGRLRTFALKVGRNSDGNFLQTEAQWLRTLGEHNLRHVVRWHAPFRNNHDPATIGSTRLDDDTVIDYLVTDFIAGPSLDQTRKMFRHEYLPWHDTLIIIQALAADLAIVHGLQIIHHDIKDTNVLLRRPLHMLTWIKPKPVLIDFGAAERPDRLNVVPMGTKQWIAPERVGPNATQTQPASDVFALGLLLETLLGDQPRSTATNQLIDAMKHQDHQLRPSAAKVANEIAWLLRQNRRRGLFRPWPTWRPALAALLIGLMLGIALYVFGGSNEYIGRGFELLGLPNLAQPTSQPSAGPTALPATRTRLALLQASMSATATPTNTPSLVSTPTAMGDPSRLPTRLPSVPASTATQFSFQSATPTSLSANVPTLTLMPSPIPSTTPTSTNVVPISQPPSPTVEQEIPVTVTASPPPILPSSSPITPNIEPTVRPSATANVPIESPTIRPTLTTEPTSVPYPDPDTQPTVRPTDETYPDPPDEPPTVPTATTPPFLPTEEPTEPSYPPPNTIRSTPTSQPTAPPEPTEPSYPYP